MEQLLQQQQQIFAQLQAQLQPAAASVVPAPAPAANGTGAAGGALSDAQAQLALLQQQQQLLAQQQLQPQEQQRPAAEQPPPPPAGIAPPSAPPGDAAAAQSSQQQQLLQLQLQQLRNLQQQQLSAQQPADGQPAVAAAQPAPLPASQPQDPSAAMLQQQLQSATQQQSLQASQLLAQAQQHPQSLNAEQAAAAAQELAQRRQQPAAESAGLSMLGLPQHALQPAVPDAAGAAAQQPLMLQLQLQQQQLAAQLQNQQMQQQQQQLQQQLQQQQQQLQQQLQVVQQPLAAAAGLSAFGMSPMFSMPGGGFGALQGLGMAGGAAADTGGVVEQPPVPASQDQQHPERQGEPLDAESEQDLREWRAAKARRDYTTSDAIRAKLRSRGVEPELAVASSQPGKSNARADPQQAALRQRRRDAAAAVFEIAQLPNEVPVGKVAALFREATGMAFASRQIGVVERMDNAAVVPVFEFADAQQVERMFGGSSVTYSRLSAMARDLKDGQPPQPAPQGGGGGGGAPAAAGVSAVSIPALSPLTPQLALPGAAEMLAAQTNLGLMSGGLMGMAGMPGMGMAGIPGMASMLGMGGGISLPLTGLAPLQMQMPLPAAAADSALPAVKRRRGDNDVDVGGLVVKL